MRSKLACFSLAISAGLYATAAHAQQDNAATVEALFSDGKQLMAAGKTAEACPKFLASYTLEARLGTLLNLAACYEKNGQISSAWARFVEARTLATRANQPDRATFAGEHASALEPRRSLLTISVDHPADGLVVKRDGVVVNPAAYGVAVPVDGGSHTIDASAPGKKPVTATMTVGAESDRKSYTLTPLLDAPAAMAASAGSGAATGAGSDASPAPSQNGSTRKWIGIGVGGLGVIAAGVGVAFGVQALSKNSDSNANGNCTGNLCNQAGYDARNTARSDGDISSVLVGVGAAAIVGGVVLWLTAPKGETTKASASHVVVGVAPTGIDVRGVF
jgi:hypothetical protein